MDFDGSWGGVFGGSDFRVKTFFWGFGKTVAVRAS